MFGYIKPFKPQLRFCEYDAYKAVYCGLCKQLGESFGPAARLTLSYDFVFYCMLGYSVRGQQADIRMSRCCVNPLKKVPMAQPDSMLREGADLASIMIYYKLLDNIHDGSLPRRCLWRVLRPLFAGAYGKAKAARPEYDRIVAQSVEAQAGLEQDGCRSVDGASEPTARAMADICRGLGAEEGQRRVLERLGYLIGRYVYLSDALDDMRDDIKSGNYNPFVLAYELDKPDAAKMRDIRDKTRETLYLTAAEAGKAWTLLDTELFAPVLENIMLQGLRAGVDDILRRQGGRAGQAN